jgi:hypothetical protein
VKHLFDVSGGYTADVGLIERGVHVVVGAGG